MKYVDRAKVVLVLSLAALSAAGCYNKKEEQLRALYHDNDVLRQDKARLSKEVADAKEKHAELLALLDSKDGQLKVAGEEIVALKTKVKDLETRGPDRDTDDTGDEGTSEKEKVFTVGSDVLFGPGQATLTAGGRRELNRVIGILKSRYSGKSIRIYGHTDGDPIVKSRAKWKDNLHLSGARAMEVRRYLVAKGLTAEDIETIAMGSSNPIASNKTAVGKRKNRRVEISVVLRK